jgi:membrane-associated phospholipid phosphatase
MTSFIHLWDNTIGTFFFALRSPFLTSVFGTVTWLGNWQFVIAVFIVVGAALYFTDRKKLLIGLLVSLGFTETVVFFAKTFFHRARPLQALVLQNDYSFPSGHAAISIALYGFIAYVLTQLYTKRHHKIIVSLGVVLMIVMIGVSRLYLGVHYFTDIIGGYGVGLLGLLLGIYFSRYGKNDSTH